MNVSKVDLTKERLRTMSRGDKIGSDAIAKSLRSYETKPHPILLERLSHYWPDIDAGTTVQGRTFVYHPNVKSTTGSQLMNYAFQSFYDQEPTDTVEVMYPKISRSTSALFGRQESHSMFEEVELWINEEYELDTDKIVNLRSLANREIGSAKVTQILDNVINSTLTLGIRQLVFDNNTSFPSSKYLVVSDRITPKDLIMKTKYYVSRNDNRAYCADYSKLRSLVASCLNRLVSPKSMPARRRLHSARILRPDKKDILDLYFPPKRDGCKSYLVLTDISNFTGSFANAWLLIYIMGLETSLGRLEDCTQLFSIGTAFLTAKWSELLLLYTYLTVGVPCWVDDLSVFAHLPGGFLGVNGNMSTGLLCFAVVLQDLQVRLRQQYPHVLTQAGGDDVGFAIQCKDTEIDEIKDVIETELTLYVGKIKEIFVYCLDEIDQGYMGAEFCKKRIILTRENREIRLRGELSVPLPETLLSSTTLRGMPNKVKAWRELDSTLSVYDSLVPDDLVLTDTLRQLFLELHPHVLPRRSQQIKHLTSFLSLQRYDGEQLLSSLAHTVICNVAEEWYDGICALSRYSSKLRHALILEQVTLVIVEDPVEGSNKIILTKKELNQLALTRSTETIYLSYDLILLRELLLISKSSSLL